MKRTSKKTQNEDIRQFLPLQLDEADENSNIMSLLNLIS